MLKRGGKKTLKWEIPTAICIEDFRSITHTHSLSRSLSMKKNIASFSKIISLLLLLQFSSVLCSARSARRANPPDLGTNIVLSSLASSNMSMCVFSPLLVKIRTNIPTIRTVGSADPKLKILSKVPYDEKIGRLTLRITALRSGPFISSWKLLPCMVEMLTTAFNAVWMVPDQHPTLQDDKFVCSENGLTLTVLSNPPPLMNMEYGDLVDLARLLLNFQQAYLLPGISFDFLEGGHQTGSGNLDWNRAEGSLPSLEQA